MERSSGKRLLRVLCVGGANPSLSRPAPTRFWLTGQWARVRTEIKSYCDLSGVAVAHSYLMKGARENAAAARALPDRGSISGRGGIRRKRSGVRRARSALSRSAHAAGPTYRRLSRDGRGCRAGGAPRGVRKAGLAEGCPPVWAVAAGHCNQSREAARATRFRARRDGGLRFGESGAAERRRRGLGS